ncbi:MAG: polysaccharide biosynthesis tyrosine autokinase [Mycobacterium sp.]
MIALAVALVGAVLGLVGSLVATPQYEARAQIYVSTTGGAPVSNASYQETAASQAMALSLVQLLHSPAVLERVIDTLQLDTSVADVEAKMEATVEPETVLIDLGVTDSSPAMAREIANASAFEFADFVDELQIKTSPSTPKPKVTLVGPAVIPTVPVSPNATRNVGLGAIAGFVVGLALANLRGRFIHSVRDPETLESITGRPPLGAVPMTKPRGKDPFTSVTGDAAAMECFREIRTNLAHALEGSASRVVTVTSAELKEGKTTVACGLGAALADAGHRVLVVDADLRWPGLTEALRMAEEVGLAEVLDGGYEPGDAIRALPDLQVDFLPAGRITLQPSELLGSSAAEKLLQQLGEAYDYVILCTPAVLAYTDAAVVSRYSDGVVLVARFAEVEAGDLHSAVTRLVKIDAPVLGAVFTDAPVPDALKRSLRMRR